MFCPNCDAILVPLKNKENEKEATNSQILGCMDCDYRSDDKEELENYIIKEQIKHSPKSKIEVVNKSETDISITAEFREELREQFREALTNS